MDSNEIKSMIENALPGADVSVESPDGVHFTATIVAEQFAGKLPIARHRLVYSALGDGMEEKIHALSMQTLTPAESAKKS